MNNLADQLIAVVAEEAEHCERVLVVGYARAYPEPGFLGFLPFYHLAKDDTGKVRRVIPPQITR